MQITKNCHYVSRFLTRPWETAERQLHFYDFDTDTFDKKSSRTLLAEDELNSQAVETWLGRVIETPLAHVRGRLTIGDPTALDDPRFFRAAMLMVWLQGARTASINDEDVRKRMDELAVKPEAETDALVDTLRSEFDLQLIGTVAEAGRLAPLFYPSTGLFPFAFVDSACLSGWSIGFGLPLALHCALIVTPHDRRGKQDVAEVSNRLQAATIGTTASRVIVEPGVIGSMPLPQVRDTILLLRQQNNHIVDAVFEKRSLLREAHMRAGIKVASDICGRLYIT